MLNQANAISNSLLSKMKHRKEEFMDAVEASETQKNIQRNQNVVSIYSNTAGHMVREIIPENIVSAETMVIKKQLYS